jgi:hypothetical protein
VDPIVRKAIGRVRNACDNRVSVAKYHENALLLTYSTEIHTQRAIAFRSLFGILVPEQGAIQTVPDPEDCLAFATPDRSSNTDEAWHRLRHWAQAREPEATAVATDFMREQAAAFVEQHAAALDLETAQLERWIARRAHAICGPRQHEAVDLFGTGPIGPIWRTAASPLDRLAAFATDMTNPATDRRAADAAATLYHRRRCNVPRLSDPILHVVGMLLLVPTP